MKQPLSAAFVFWLPRALLAILVLFSVIPLFNTGLFIIDLISHFRVQYFLCAVVALIFFAINRRKPWILISIFCVGVNGGLIVPFYLQLPNNVAIENPKLRLLVANVHSRNTHHDEFISIVRAQDPDVVAAMEVTPQWKDALRAINENYPFSEIVPGIGNFGIALFSKHPFSRIELKTFVSGGPLSVVGEIRFADQTLKIIATHPVPPGVARFFCVKEPAIKGNRKVR